MLIGIDSVDLMDGAELSDNVVFGLLAGTTIVRGPLGTVYTIVVRGRRLCCISTDEKTIGAELGSGGFNGSISVDLNRPKKGVRRFLQQERMSDRR